MILKIKWTTTKQWEGWAEQRPGTLEGGRWWVRAWSTERRKGLLVFGVGLRLLGVFLPSRKKLGWMGLRLSEGICYVLCLSCRGVTRRGCRYRYRRDVAEGLLQALATRVEGSLVCRGSVALRRALLGGYETVYEG